METTPRRILVIDDNTYAADTLTLILGHWGHKVQVAYDGRSGVALASAFSPEVILLDIEMPGMNGIEVAERIRADPGFHGVILVAVSGHDLGEGSPERGFSLFDQHLRKPLDPKLLERLLLRGLTSRWRPASPHSV